MIMTQPELLKGLILAGLTDNERGESSRPLLRQFQESLTYGGLSQACRLARGLDVLN